MPVKRHLSFDLICLNDPRDKYAVLPIDENCFAKQGFMQIASFVALRVNEAQWAELHLERKPTLSRPIISVRYALTDETVSNHVLGSPLSGTKGHFNLRND